MIKTFNIHLYIDVGKTQIYIYINIYIHIYKYIFFNIDNKRRIFSFERTYVYIYIYMKNAEKRVYISRFIFINIRLNIVYTEICTFTL